MILEEVQSHPDRDDMYIDKVITAAEYVKEKDKMIINNILLEEITEHQLH